MAGWSNYGNVRKCLPPGSRTVSAKVEGGLSFLSSRREEETGGLRWVGGGGVDYILLIH